MSKLKFNKGLLILCAFGAFSMNVNLVLGEDPLLWPQDSSEREKFSKLERKAKTLVDFVELRGDRPESVYRGFFTERHLNVSDFLPFNGSPSDLAYVIALSDIGFSFEAIKSWNPEMRKEIFDFLKDCFVPDECLFKFFLDEELHGSAVNLVLRGLGYARDERYRLTPEEQERAVTENVAQNRRITDLIRRAMSSGSESTPTT